MARVQMTVENLQEVQRAMRKFGRDAERAIGRAVQATAVEVRSDIQRRIQRGPKTGMTYMRGTVSHIASAPGEAPATDTGTLVSSITYHQRGAMTAEIESRLDYAPMLEFGTQRMEPRPSWTPAMEAKRPDFVRRVSDAIRGLM